MGKVDFYCKVLTAPSILLRGFFAGWHSEFSMLLYCSCSCESFHSAQHGHFFNDNRNDCPYLLTYLLTPWSRVLLEKLTSKFCSYSRNSPHLWNPILSQLHPVPTTPSNFLKIHLNIILPSTSWSPQWP